MRRIVQPQHDLIFRQILGVHLRPIGGRFEREVLFCRQLAIKRHRIFGELNMRAFHRGAIKCDRAEGGVFAAHGCGDENQHENVRYGENPVHRSVFLESILAVRRGSERQSGLYFFPSSIVRNKFNRMKGSMLIDRG